jgi:hypothetical protein
MFIKPLIDPVILNAYARQRLIIAARTTKENRRPPTPDPALLIAFARLLQRWNH